MGISTCNGLLLLPPVFATRCQTPLTNESEKTTKKGTPGHTHSAGLQKKPKPWTTYCFSLDPLLPFVVFARVRLSVKLTCKSLERAGLIVLTLTRLLIIQKGK